MPTTYVLFGGIVIPIGDLASVQSLSSTAGHVYLGFSITDPVEGALTFYWSDIPFIESNAYGGAQVYAAVTSWGNLVKYLPEQGARENQAVIRLALDAKVSPSNQAGKIFTVADIFRGMDVRDKAVTIYQWNELGTLQEPIWSGFWGGVVDYSFDNGVATVGVSLSPVERDTTETIADIITKAAFPSTPNASIGLMSPRCYGSLTTTTDSAQEDATTVLKPCFLGYGQAASQAVPVDELSASVTPGARYRVCQNDGIAASKTAVSSIDLETDHTPIIGNYYIYDSTVGAYGAIESSTDSLLGSDNNVTNTRVDVSNAPRVYFALRPTNKHSSTSSGITDTGDAVDDDPTNYSVLTSTNNILAYECPSISLPSGATILDVRVVTDMKYQVAHNPNGVSVGLWNPYAASGATWWGGANYYENNNTLIAVGTRIQIITITSGDQSVGGRFGAWGAAQANVSGTLSEFARGQFVGIDGTDSDARKPILIRLQWNSSGTAEYRVYSVALLVKIVYPLVKTGERRVAFGKTDIEGNFLNPEPRKIIEIFSVPDALPGLQVIFDGEFQKDDGSGTITGAASALIEKGPDVARHLVQVVGSKTVNSTTGSLGNFVDARVEAVAGEKVVTARFGPSEVFTRPGALDELMARYPWLKVYPEDGTYQCVIDHLNPLSSQLYRNSSELVSIEPWDIIGGTFNLEEVDVRKIVNKVTVDAGHSYGRNAPLASYTYDNPLSQGYWGVVELVPNISNPWLHVADLSIGATEGMKYLARFFGQRAARPRLTVTVGLTQKFYDLRPGHVLEFSGNMEAAGLHCPAYRTGRLDYAFGADTGTNQADDTTPILVSGGSVDRSPKFGMSQQTDQITFNVSTAGAYTANANPWQYYDGASLVNLTGLSCSDGGAASTLFTRLGKITLSFTRPTPTSWKKAERTLASNPLGPVYWLQHNATTVTTAALGDALTTIPAKWQGRQLIVVETNRRVGADKYPYMEAVLQEVM